MNTFVIEKEKICQNAEEIIKRAGGAAVIAVIKGRGYGFGCDDYVKLLHECGIRFFAVTEPEDAAKIRELALDETEILMLRSTALSDELSLLIENDVILTIGSTAAAVAANDIAESMSKTARAHVKIDTGMGRYGFTPDDVDSCAAVFTSFSHLKAIGLYTHLTSAFRSKKESHEQIAALYSVNDRLTERGIVCETLHFANSSYLFRADEGDDLGGAVRIGSAFTGRLPFKAKRSGLARVGHLESRVCEIRWLKKGATIGYSRAFKAKSPMRIAIVPLGYADGFHAEKARDSFRIRDGLFYALSDMKKAIFKKRIFVTVNGKRARVLGHIGMTHTVCDVTDIDCNIGDTACFDVNPVYVSADVAKKYV